MPTTKAPAPQGVNCYPLPHHGNCYKINEFCRKGDIGTSGIDVNGNPMTCTPDGKRPRWR